MRTIELQNGGYVVEILLDLVDDVKEAEDMHLLRELACWCKCVSRITYNGSRLVIEHNLDRDIMRCMSHVIFHKMKAIDLFGEHGKNVTVDIVMTLDAVGPKSIEWPHEEFNQFAERET